MRLSDTSHRAAALGSIALAFALAAFVACSSPSDARIGVVAPDESRFPPVSELLDHRCGSLDCHGNAQRNLVIWGCEGLRLDPAMTPGCGRGKDTTDAEYHATYRSLVGLEPAVMSNVVANHGRNPELLTFVRKARGDESHKGGALVVPGDAQDRCIALWLAGGADPAFQDTCVSALSTP